MTAAAIGVPLVRRSAWTQSWPLKRAEVVSRFDLRSQRVIDAVQDLSDESGQILPNLGRCRCVGLGSNDIGVSVHTFTDGDVPHRKSDLTSGKNG